MPLYTFLCDCCPAVQEHLVRYDDRDKTLPCTCGGQMERQGVESFAVGQPAYQMQGILSDGTHVPGHFGKDAKRDKSKRRKK